MHVSSKDPFGQDKIRHIVHANPFHQGIVTSVFALSTRLTCSPARNFFPPGKDRTVSLPTKILFSNSLYFGEPVRNATTNTVVPLAHTPPSHHTPTKTRRQVLTHQSKYSHTSNSPPPVPESPPTSPASAPESHSTPPPDIPHRPSPQGLWNPASRVSGPDRSSANRHLGPRWH